MTHAQDDTIPVCRVRAEPLSGQSQAIPAEEVRDRAGKRQTSDLPFPASPRFWPRPRTGSPERKGQGGLGISAFLFASCLFHLNLNLYLCPYPYSPSPWPDSSSTPPLPMTHPTPSPAADDGRGVSDGRSDGRGQKRPPTTSRAPTIGPLSAVPLEPVCHAATARCAATLSREVFPAPTAAWIALTASSPSQIAAGDQLSLLLLLLISPLTLVALALLIILLPMPIRLLPAQLPSPMLLRLRLQFPPLPLFPCS